MPTVNNALDRSFGIEMEYSFNRLSLREVGQRIQERFRTIPGARGFYPYDDGRVPSDEQRRNPHNFWRLGYDGDGFEIRTPASKWENWEEIRAATEVIRADSHYSNANGMHCHFGTSDMSHDEMVRWTALWCALEAGIFQLVHRSRRTNAYCTALLTYSSWETVRTNLLVHNNYGWVAGIPRRALHPVSRWNTCEVRLHQASLDPRKQRGWIYMIQALMHHAKVGIDNIAIVQDIYNTTPTEKIQWIMNKTSEHLPNGKARWLRQHLAWRAERYAQITGLIT